MFFLLFFIIVLPDVAFCSAQQAINFFEEQFELSIKLDKDIAYFSNLQQEIEKSAKQLKNMYPKLYQSGMVIHDFTSVNKYNLLTISTILLAAESVKTECPEIFNFLETNGLCSKNCGNLKEVTIMRGTAFKFNNDNNNKKFMPKVGKFVQLFLYTSCWPETPFADLLEKKDYKDKLFDIVAQYYVDENDIKILKTKYKKFGLKEKSSFELLINKYDYLKKRTDNEVKENDNNDNKDTKQKKWFGKKKKKDEKNGENSNLSSYIPYIVISSGLLAIFLYFYFKKRPASN